MKIKFLKNGKRYWKGETMILICGSGKLFGRDKLGINNIEVYPGFIKQKYLVFRLFRRVMNNLFINKKPIFKEKGTIIIFDSFCNKKYLRWVSTHSNSKRLIFWYWNPVCDSIKVEDIPSNFEIWSYSKSDCEKYGFKWNSTFIPSDLNSAYDENAESDIVFIGRAKGRTDLIKRIELNAQKKGYKTNIVLTKRKKYDFKNRKLPNLIPYKKYLELEMSSKAILDIGINNEVGMTLRSLEACKLNKKLICNYKEILLSFVPNKNIYYIVSPDDILSSKFDEFMQSPAEQVSKDVLDYYSFDRWIERFGIDE